MPKSFSIDTVNVNSLTGDFVLDFLDSLGAKHTGSGAFAKVFKVSDEEVIKVFYDDEGYTRFLRVISRMGNNSYVPVISWVTRVIGTDGDTAYMVSMERLVDVYSLGDEERKVFNNFRSIVREFVGDAGYYSTDESRATGFRGLDEVVIEAILPPDLIELINEMNDVVFSSDDVCTDLHAGNLMIRPLTRDIVITDPFVC